MVDERDVAALQQVSESLASARPAVIARVSPAQEQALNLRFVRATDMVSPALRRICLPRGDTPQTGFDRYGAVVALSSDLLAKLQQENGRVINWLAASAENARLFMMDPVGALRELGVNITRAEEKAIARARADLTEAVVPPGTNLRAVDAKAYARGAVGRIGASATSREGSGTRIKATTGARKRGCVKE